MAYTYKGTKIKGQDTKLKKGHKGKKNNTYLNTSSGNVYKATKDGDKSDKIWKYKETVVVSKPSITVTNLGAPTRSSGTMTASWGVPADLKSDKKGDRATGLRVDWSLSQANKTNPSAVTQKLGTDKTSTSINLNSITIGNKAYTRNSFHPVTLNNFLYSVTAKVTPYNAKGDSSKNSVATRNFAIPRKPTLEPYEFDNDTGVVSIQIKTVYPEGVDANTDYQERYDTWFKMSAYDSRTNETTVVHNTSSTSTDFTKTYNVTSYQSLNYEDYIQVDSSAYSRGYRGNSDPVSRRYYVAYPAQTLIDDIKISSRDMMGKCTVYINTNTADNPEHPVDQVRLEYLANVSYRNAASIPVNASWTATDIVDDANCSALSIGVTNLIPDPGKYTWVRVKSYHINENVLYRYSEPRRLEDLETPVATAADDDITIIGAQAGTDGKSVIVNLGWNKDGTDDSTGTELSWSDEEDSWKSTENPTSYNFTWSDGPAYKLTTDTTAAAGKDYYSKSGDTYTKITPAPANPKTAGAYEMEYHDSATITIKNLQESTQYFIKARRYKEDETTTYSEYSNIESCLTSETPPAVVASCPGVVPIGSALPVYWVFSGSSIQTNWQIIEQIAYTSGNDTLYKDGAVIAEGNNSLGSTQIAADRLTEFITEDNDLRFTVQVSTGSGWVISEQQVVQFVEAPTLTVSATTPVTAQPVTFSATSNIECDLTVILSSQGAVSQFPDGVKRQTKNDTIYSGVIHPVWTSSNSAYTTTVTLPGGLDLWNKCAYTLSVVATDTSTGLKSDEAISTITINWSNPAVSMQPITTYVSTTDVTVNEDQTYYEYNSVTEEYDMVDPIGTENPSTEGWYVANVTSPVELTAIDMVEDTGYHRKAVQIDLIPATGCGQNDVYDIYRLTGDGAYLIGRGFPLTYTAVDEYAPFGDELTLYYRVAIRTPDGDVAFCDYEYFADGAVMRFDWQGGSLELPYNIDIGDKYAKDVEIRKHLNGDSDAYWNQGVTRNGSLKSDLIRLEQQDDVTRARQLARYPGAVFVRTPDGSAYEADVQVTDMSVDGPLEAIAIDATEIALTPAFILPIPFELEDEE